jgi:hypothetical protein
MDSSNKSGEWPATERPNLERPPSIAETESEFGDLSTPVNSSTTLFIPHDVRKAAESGWEQDRQKASASLSRRQLVWEGMVQLAVTFVLGEEYTRFGPGMDWSSTGHFNLPPIRIQAPRVGYLGLLLPKLQPAITLNHGCSMEPPIWWFEDTEMGYIRW